MLVHHSSLTSFFSLLTQLVFSFPRRNPTSCWLSKKDVRMLHCPVDKMIVDCSSKPTQGSLFDFQRGSMLGIKKEDFEMHKA